MTQDTMNLQQVAQYLHLDARKVERLAARDKLPARRVAGEWVFNRAQISEWVEQRLSEYSNDELNKLEKGLESSSEVSPSDLLVSPMLSEAGIVKPLNAKTPAKVLRALVRAAEHTGLLYDGPVMLTALERREQLCSTAVERGVAFPHPRRVMPNILGDSFIVFGHTPTGIFYGAPDRSETDLFFLLCCLDERIHLHVLARLARMLNSPAFLDELRSLDSAGEIITLLQRREQEVIQ